MMKTVNKIFQGILMSLLLAGMGCSRQAVLYDSSGASEELLETEAKEAKAGDRTEEAEALAGICVYVCGEVVKPGVYELEASARIGEAVEAAGGMTEEAAESWLNLAEHVTDGQKIEVPSKEQAQKLKEQAAEQENGLVNLNTATAEQLMALSGIGESKAADILSYREQKGGFQSIEELMQIPGIKERVFEKIKDQITV